MQAGVVSVSARGPHAFQDFRSGWRGQAGDAFPMPTLSKATSANLRDIRYRAFWTRDVIFSAVDNASSIRTAGGPSGATDSVRLWIVRRGAWTLGDGRDDSEHVVPGGRFLLRHVGRLARSAISAASSTQVLVLPADALSPLLGGRTLSGPIRTPEVRLLVAHAAMVHRMLKAGLSPAGIGAAGATLVELAKAVALGGFDDTDPRLAPALVQAAKNLADQRLTDPALSTGSLARELHVSARTLQRAFADEGGSATAYIRDRRLAQARMALATPSRRWSVSELAAHWQFADSSHFSRAFKRRYGLTPTAYAAQASR